MVPSIIGYLRPYFDEIRFDELKYSLFCGEALYEHIALEWMKCVPNARVENVYGPTEATIFCLTYDMCREGRNKSFNGIVCIGRPMRGMGAIVVDEDLQPVRDGEKGELCLTGSQVTGGYWENPEKSKEAFFTRLEDGIRREYYRTGDLAFRDAEGDFMFGGRLDQQVKIQGFRIELGEIEHHARAFTKMANVAAVADCSVGVGDVSVHLFVEGYSGNVEQISTYLKTKVPQYMIPSRIHNVSAFPFNVNGKVDRKALLRIAQGAAMKVGT
jgi:acyl-coenzyme A synthetase/AMP-(fatty) acid ligase